MRRKKVKLQKSTPPKAGDPGPTLLTELINKPLVDARAARMQALGFRKTTRKR